MIEQLHYQRINGKCNIATTSSDRYKKQVDNHQANAAQEYVGIDTEETSFLTCDKQLAPTNAE